MKKNKSNFKKYKLNQLGHLDRGRSRYRPRNHPSLYGGDYPFIQTAEIKAANLYVNEFKNTYNEKGLRQSKLWPKETLCITIAANIAETAILNFPSCFPDSIVGFIANDKLTETKYIKYYIDYIKTNIQNISHGTTQDNLSLKKLLLVDFLIPNDFNEQKKIVTFLSNYDKLIENNFNRIKLLKEITNKLFNEWFVNFRFPEHKNVSMGQSKLGKIPKGWEYQKLSNICKVIPGYAFKSNDWENEGVPVIRIKNIKNNNEVDTKQVVFVSEDIFNSTDKKFNITNGDILIAMTGATAGKIGIFRNNNISLLNQRVAKFLPKKYYYYEYLWCYLTNPILKKFFFNLADGTAQPNMSGNQLENIDLLIPSLEIVKKFSKIISPTIKMISNLFLKKQIIQDKKDLLLPKLISGEINISNLNIKTINKAA